MKCTRCQNQIRNDAKFCPVCGTRVERHTGVEIGTILLATVILLSVTIIGGVAGIMLTDGLNGDHSVITLFSEEVVPQVKEAPATDHTAEDEPDAPDPTYDVIAADAEVDNHIPDHSDEASSGFDNAPLLPGKLSEEQLQKISTVLGVPEDLDTRITQGSPTYWEGGDMYRTMVSIYHDEEFIAGASVDSFTGNIAGTVSTYSEPEDPLPVEESHNVTGFVSNAENGLNVRERPSTSSKSVRRIYNGEPVVITEQVVEEGLHWGRISGGWICTNYVTFEGEYSALGDLSEESSPEVYMVSPSVDVVNVRSDAGTSYQTISRVAGGEEVMIFTQKTAEGRAWGRTDLGWVCMDYLIPSGFVTVTEYDDEDIDFSEFEEDSSLDDFFV